MLQALSRLAPGHTIYEQASDAGCRGLDRRYPVCFSANHTERLRSRRVSRVSHKMTIQSHAIDFFCSRLAPPAFRIFRPRVTRAFNEMKKVSRQKTAWQYSRAIDLQLLLRRYRPKTIVEMGSGLSTVLFALYAQQRGAKLTTLEENPEWAAVTTKALRAAGVAEFTPTVANKISDHGFVSYDATLPDSIDLFYIDGPANKVDGVTYHICSDILKLTSRRVLPAVIVIDGRIGTTAALLESPAGNLYDWHVSERALRKPRSAAISALPCRIGHHSIAVRRSYEERASPTGRSLDGR